MFMMMPIGAMWRSRLVLSAAALVGCVSQLGGCIFNVDEVNMTSKDMAANNVTPDMRMKGDMKVTPDQGQPDQGPVDMRGDLAGDMSLPTDMDPSCEDGPMQLCCDGKRVDPSKDPNNCGACGHRCGSGDACILGACVCAEGTQGQSLMLRLASDDKLLFVPYLGPERLVGSESDGIEQRLGDDPDVHTYTVGWYKPGAQTLTVAGLDGRGALISNSLVYLELFNSSQKVELRQLVLSPQIGGDLLIGAWVSSSDGEQIYLFTARKDPASGQFQLAGNGRKIATRKRLLGLGINKYSPEGAVLVYASQTSFSTGASLLQIEGEDLGALNSTLPAVSVGESYTNIEGPLQVSIGGAGLNVSWLSRDNAVGASEQSYYGYKQLYYSKGAMDNYQTSQTNYSSYDSALVNAKTKSQALWQLQPTDAGGWLYFHGRQVESLQGLRTDTSVHLWDGAASRSTQKLAAARTLIDQDWAPRVSARPSAEVVWIESQLLDVLGGRPYHAVVDAGMTATISPARPLSKGAELYSEVLTSLGTRSTTGIIGVKHSTGGKELHFFMSVEGQSVCAPSTWRKAN